MSFLHSGLRSTADASSTLTIFDATSAGGGGFAPARIAMETRMRSDHNWDCRCERRGGRVQRRTVGARQCAGDAILQPQLPARASGAPVATAGRADATPPAKRATPSAACLARSDDSGGHDLPIVLDTGRRFRHQPRRAAGRRASRSRGHRRRRDGARRTARACHGVVTDATRSAKVKGRAHVAVRFDSRDAARRRRALRDPDDVGRPHRAGDEEGRRGEDRRAGRGRRDHRRDRRRQEGRGHRHGDADVPRRRRHRRRHGGRSLGPQAADHLLDRVVHRCLRS